MIRADVHVLSAFPTYRCPDVPAGVPTYRSDITVPPETSTHVRRPLKHQNHGRRCDESHRVSSKSYYHSMGNLRDASPSGAKDKNHDAVTTSLPVPSTPATSTPAESTPLTSMSAPPTSVSSASASPTAAPTETAESSAVSDHQSSDRQQTDWRPFDHRRCINQRLHFAYARQAFATANLPWSNDVLTSLHIIEDFGGQENTKADAANGHRQRIFSNTALLISDENPYAIKFAVFQGDSKATMLDQIALRGSAMQLINDAMVMFNENNTQSAWPQNAFREALVNAVIHRDYRYSGPILVSMFDQRIEVVSLGGLVEGLEVNDLLNGICQPRNAWFAEVLKASPARNCASALPRWSWCCPNQCYPTTHGQYHAPTCGRNGRRKPHPSTVMGTMPPQITRDTAPPHAISSPRPTHR